MIKKLVVVFIASFALQLHAQQGTVSPYSFFGIGSLKFKGTVENRSMGGLSIYTDSIHVNLRNPASYATPNLRSFSNGESRPVKFAIAGSQQSLKLQSDSGSDRSTATTFDYLALSFPMGKFGFGFGLLPYTSVGYKIQSENEDGDLTNKYTGEGGLNKTYLGVGYAITPKLSVGVDFSYNFGNVKNNVEEYFYDNGDFIQYPTVERNRSNLSGASVNFGVTYKTMIKEKYELVTTLTYAPESKLTSKNTRTFLTGDGTSLEADLESQGLDETKLSMPSRLSFGAGIGQPRRWFVGAEYTTQNTSAFSNPFLDSNNTNFVNASNFSFGGFFIPEYDSFSKYWKRITYRAGMHFEHTGLEISNEDITEFGISFGAGFPVGGVFSNANLGLEFGKRGTTNQNLIQENFANILISLSLNDRWFIKRKYN